MCVQCCLSQSCPQAHFQTAPWRRLLQLTDVKAMLGCTGETRFLLGCISQLQDGSYFLEDMTGALQLDLSECQTSTGLYTGELCADAAPCTALSTQPAAQEE